MRNYSHIIWDWNGTIINDAQISLDVFNTLASNYNIASVDFDDYRNEFGFPVIDFYKRHGFDFSKVDFRKIGRDFIEMYHKLLPENPLHKGIADILKSFLDSGITQSVLSAHNADMLRADVERLGLSEFFVKVDGLSDIYANSKTRLGIAHIQALGISPNDILMVGDTEFDVLGAAAHGIATVGVSWGYGKVAAMEKAGAAAIVHTMEELLSFINQ
jgi:phosphoglycolate phosphatase